MAVSLRRKRRDRAIAMAIVGALAAAAPCALGQNGKAAPPAPLVSELYQPHLFNDPVTKAKTAPDVTQLTHAVAAERLKADGFASMPRVDPTRGNPAAVVYDQLPKPNAPVTGSTIYLYLQAPAQKTTAAGTPEVAIVPALAGRTVDEAATILQAAHLRLGDPVGMTTTFPGAVIGSTSPAAGASLAPDSAVAYSLRPEPVVPDVHGLTPHAAAGRLNARGLRLGVSIGPGTFSQTVRVDYTSPAAGASAAAGTSVDYFPAPTFVRVPKVVEFSASAAARTLAADGLKASPSVSGNDKRMVTAQTPAAGVQVEAGSAIALTFSGAAPWDWFIGHPWLSVAGVIAAGAAAAGLHRWLFPPLIRVVPQLEGGYAILSPNTSTLQAGVEASWTCEAWPPRLLSAPPSASLGDRA